MAVMTIRRPGTIPAARPAAARRPRSFSDSFDFGAYREAVPTARLRTRALLREWGLADLSADVEAVVTELIQNAVTATGRAGLDAPVRLTLIGGLRTVLVVVRDAVADPPVPRPPAAPADLSAWDGDDEDADPDQHGRGLLIVAALSAHWDWKAARGGGKAVRALIRGSAVPDPAHGRPGRRAASAARNGRTGTMPDLAPAGYRDEDT